MIQIIYGSKGSGKTKKMIEAVNAAAMKEHGDVVFITDTDRYSSEIKYSVRFTNTQSHGIFSEDSLLGFIKGLIAGNYDIKEMYIDGAMRIIGVSVTGLESFVTALQKIGQDADVKFVLAVSAAEEELPAFLKKLI